MVNFQVVHNTSKSRDEIWQWIETNGGDALKRKVPRENIKLSARPDQNKFIVKGEMIKAEIRVKDGEIVFDIDIPILFRPFKSNIEAALKEMLLELG